MKSLGESIEMQVKTTKTGVWFESCAAPRTRHNANLPEIIIKGRIINLSKTRGNNFKKNKEVQNEYK